jgi:hypothetical protein
MPYYERPEELPKVSRKLIHCDSPQLHDCYKNLVAQLQGDELLFGLYDRGFFMNAAQLFSLAEFMEFEKQVQGGVIRRIGFFALAKATALVNVGRDLQDQKAY